MTMTAAPAPTAPALPNMLHDGVLGMIGNTPKVDVSNLSPNPNVRMLAKLEMQNPFGSVKDRIAKAMIEAAERDGKLLPGQTIWNPINEPVAKYGPFVMNTQLEIQQAMEEYKLTQFGGWPWPHADNVHPREKGRFAKYPNGDVVER